MFVGDDVDDDVVMFTCLLCLSWNIILNDIRVSFFYPPVAKTELKKEVAHGSILVAASGCDSTATVQTISNNSRSKNQRGECSGQFKAQ